MGRRRVRGLGCLGCLPFGGLLVMLLPLIAIGAVIYFLVNRKAPQPPPQPYFPPSIPPGQPPYPNPAPPTEPGAVPSGQGFCSRCGATLTGGRFCASCGAPS